MTPSSPSRETLETLAALGTATVSMQLAKRGLRRTWIAGARASAPGRRLAAPAFTLRFIPAREDIATPAALARPASLRQAIEQMPAGAVALIEARGETGAGVLGDILAGRLLQRGAAGVVTDGAVRDSAALQTLGLPLWCAGVAAPPSIAALFFADWQVPIGCGGAAVFPGEIVVADDDGAVVVPRARAAAVAADGQDQDRFERYVQEKIAEGRPVAGLYPPSEATLAEYENWEG